MAQKAVPVYVFAAALLVRLGAIAFGEAYDRYFAVKYTDVDYKVFTDAARLLAEGRSPYLRPTYRYTPLLACLMVPNVVLHGACGKVLFALADLLVGVLVFRYVRERDGATRARAATLAAVWLFNPLSINMSSRGSADSLVGAMLLAMLYALLHRSDAGAGAIYGLAVHFRLYPAVYTPVIGLHLLASGGGAPRHCRGWSWSGLARAVRFGAGAAGAFGALTAACYASFGHEFLEHTYLYHGTRVDTRHNFSPYFLSLYLCDGAGAMGSAACALSARAAGLWAFAPQLAAMLALSYSLRRELACGLYLVTLTFVAFNKVCTAQYYLWYAFFLPLVLERALRAARARAWSASAGAALLAAWCAAHLHWLYWANRLENEGGDVYLQVWLASLAYFALNVSVVVIVLRLYSGGGARAPTSAAASAVRI